MKFDFVIGNPPYQDSTTVNNRAEPIYPYFYDSIESLTDRYMLISPARFLFNTGLTSKVWNKKMLGDEHLKVVFYEQDSSKVFPNTDIKGGVVVLYRNSTEKYGAIDVFVPDDNLRSLLSRCKVAISDSLSTIVYGGRSDLKFNDLFLEKYPKTIQDRLDEIKSKHTNVTKLSPNEEYELKSLTLETFPYVYKETEPKEKDKYYKLLGLVAGKRAFRWIEKKYMVPRYPDDNNIESYKVFIPESNGSGQFGEVLSTPVLSGPGESATPTFISIGNFASKTEANNLLKYIKTKFARAMLGLNKVTQHNPKSVWKNIPLQDFTSKSDIDWSKSISEVDKQLYKKYRLSKAEIDFIETHVKEME